MDVCQPEGTSGSLSKVSFVLRWDPSRTRGVDFDLDASVIACGPDYRVYSERYFVFYNNLRSPDGAIEHAGDGIFGKAGAPYDEMVNINLRKMPVGLTQIILAVSIYDADEREQTFESVGNASAALLDENGGLVCQYNLSGGADGYTALVFGELHLQSNAWAFRPTVETYGSGLVGIARRYGVAV
jgi:tellurium resistance protein TerD